MSAPVIKKIGINKFKEIFKELPTKVFNRDSVIVYKGQVPNVALVLVEGAVFVENEEFFIKDKREALLVGVKELLDKSIMSFGVTVLEGAKVVILDRETALGLQLGV